MIDFSPMLHLFRIISYLQIYVRYYLQIATTTPHHRRTNAPPLMVRLLLLVESNTYNSIYIKYTRCMYTNITLVLHWLIEDPMGVLHEMMYAVTCSDKTINIMGIDYYQLNSIPLVTAGEVSQSLLLDPLCGEINPVIKSTSDTLQIHIENSQGQSDNKIIPLIYPSDLVRRSFIMNTNDNGEKLRAHVVGAE